MKSYENPIGIGAIKEIIRTRLADPHAIKRVEAGICRFHLERELGTRIQIGWILWNRCGTDMYSPEPQRTHWAPP